MARNATKSDRSIALKNAKHELFCWLYAGYHNRYLFGNATRCYMQAYGYVARVDKLYDAIEELDVKYAKTADKIEKEEIKTVVEQKRKEIKAIEKVAQVESSRLLSNPIINARSDFLLESYISENLADRELLKVMVQDSDLMPKVQAIKEFNRLKDRGSSGKLEGAFTFGWEGDDKPKKKPVLKKATLKKAVNEEGNVEWNK